MKYDCSDEFDLNDIFCRLVGCGSRPQTVAMNSFFAPLTLSQFQQSFEIALSRQGE